MERYLKIDGTGKIVTCDVMQNAEGTLILKEISDEQMKDIFYYSLIKDELVLSPQKGIDAVKKELVKTDSSMLRKIDELYSVLIDKGIAKKDDFIDKSTGVNYFDDAVEERKKLREKSK